ncbi:MAG: type II toxin-antitoxin system HicB family antitoxin [Actinobacteria bacterium]|nr:type II toxin-antitoxin system HicB family antitoxin [Actinomycetota bacterium]
MIVSPDTQTGTGKPGFTALSPTLGVADDGDTIEEALENVKTAIQAYVDSLVEDKQPVPVDYPQQDIVTTTQVVVSPSLQLA